MSWNFDEKVSREGTSCIKYDLRKETFGKNDVIPMWIADMDFRTPSFIIEALQKRLDHHVMGYSFRPSVYYQSIVNWLKTRHNWTIEKEWICFCPGVVPALNLCSLSFTRPGDSIIIQPPVYTPFFSAVESQGRNLVCNQLVEKDGKYTMDLDSLIASIDNKTKMIILSNPHNPVGRQWTSEELSKLADICLQRDIIIVSDEIHSDIILPGHKHTPVASISDKVADITVTCVAPSKTFNVAGLSTSSVIISNPVLRQYFEKSMERLHFDNGNIFGAIASIAAYSKGAEWLDAMLQYVSSNVTLVESYCMQHIPEIVPVHPESTYMIWLDCRKLGLSGKELNEFFIDKAGVGMNEGSTFGPGGEGFMRMNIGTTHETVERALQQIEKAVALIR